MAIIKVTNNRVAILLLALTVCCCYYYTASVQAAGVPGGLHDERESDEEIRNVVRSIHPELERASKQSFQSLEPIRYRKQVVAGANYFVKVLATRRDGHKSHIHMRIYKPFRGPLELSAIRMDQERHSPIEYFD